jgi:hypothetical protein
LEEHIASIFRVEEQAKQVVSVKQISAATCFMLVSCLGYPSTPKMEAICSSDTG